MMEKVLERVRKLLALANDEAASEGERDNALRMAYNTLAKHELDMDDVDAHVREKMDPRGKFENEGWNMNWCKSIRGTIAKLFMCKYIIGQKINATKGTHHWIGRESNVTTAMFMADWIIRSLLREADKRYKHRLTPEGRAFAVGCSDKLRERVLELLEAKQAEFKAAGSALVLADLADSEEIENDLMMQARMKTKDVTLRNARVNVSAYGAGKEFGASIGLNTQVGNKRGTLAIK